MAQPKARVTSDVVEKAVNALTKWRTSKSRSERPQLLEEDDFFYLVLTLRKIPAKDRINAYKIPLPQPLFDPASSELCLIIDDRPKSRLTKDAAKKKIQSENIPVSKIIKLSKLKTDYRPFEAKRKLCGSYDMFFADRRVIPLLPKMLGKHFFKRRRIPVPVDLTHKNWKEQISSACGSAMLYLRTGTCSVVKVARSSMEKSEIVENVMVAINGIANVVPGKWGNVRSFHLKLLDSLALPVYQVLPDMKLRIEGVKVEREDQRGEVVEEGKKDEGEELKKKNYKNMGKKRGGIHEVRYMDHNADEAFLGHNLLVTNSEDGLGEGDDGGDEETAKVELVSKRKKGHKKKDGSHSKLKGVKREKLRQADSEDDVLEMMKNRRVAGNSKSIEGKVKRRKNEKAAE